MKSLEQPTTEILRAQYGITLETELAVMEARSRLSHAIGQYQSHYISIDGGCGLTNEPELVAAEASQKVQAAQDLTGYIALDRSLCAWKPRSNPDAWFGLDTTERAAAYQIIAAQATAHSNGAAEIGSAELLERYGLMLTFGWVGGRAINSLKLAGDIAKLDPTLPLGIKNGLDGRIEPMFERVKLVEETRSGEGAPAVPIYRGGENARTPQASKDMCKRVIELTEGRVIIDTAHGVEMAHDPTGKFAKSVPGQKAATEMLLELGREGYIPLGKISEASAQVSPVDPNMPLDLSLKASRQLYEIKRNRLLVPAH